MTHSSRQFPADGIDRIDAWRVFEVGSVQYVAGRRASFDKNGVTSPVIKLDAANLRIRTLSGSVYALDGPPILGQEILRLWAAYCRKFQIDAWRDVSDDIWQMHVDMRSQSLD